MEQFKFTSVALSRGPRDQGTNPAATKVGTTTSYWEGQKMMFLLPTSKFVLAGETLFSKQEELKYVMADKQYTNQPSAFEKKTFYLPQNCHPLPLTTSQSKYIHSTHSFGPESVSKSKVWHLYPSMSSCEISGNWHFYFTFKLQY